MVRVLRSRYRRDEHLLEQVRTKQAKGKNIEIIAEELEEDEDIETIQDVLKSKLWI